MRRGGEGGGADFPQPSMAINDVIWRGNYDMVAKWRPSWNSHVGFLDFPQSSGKRQNLTKSNKNCLSNQKLYSMVTSKSMNTNRPHQITPR